MTINMKRAISLLLLAAMLTAGTSCGGTPSGNNDTPDGQEQTTETTSGETTSPLYDLEKKDYNGREFRISVNKKYEDEMWVEEENADVCNDAVYNRNVKVEDYLNIKIKTVPSENETVQVSDISKNLMAGDDVYDLTAVYTWLAGGPALQGFYYSWKDVPVVDFSREWWVTDANEAFNINGNQFVAVGDLSITTLLLSYAVFFNQRIAGANQFPNLYETVLDGKWTIDTLIDLSKDMYQDINGDGKADAGDSYGFAADKVTNLDAWTAAFDIPLTAKDSGGAPTACIDLGKTQTAIDKVYSLYYDTKTYLTGGDGKEIEVFANGNTAFLTTWINNSFSTLRAMKDDYGILPYPKFDESQESYYSNSMDNYSVLSVPKTVQDTEFVGRVTEALTRENHFSVVPAYYDVALTSKYARDEQSVAMLDIIMNGRMYDFSILHSGELANLPYFFRNLIANKKTTVASSYAKIETKVNEGLKKLAEEYAALGN